jgi:hypothetical protein
MSTGCMDNDGVPLSAYPLPKVVLQCLRCNRRGRFDKAALIARTGRQEPLPSLRLKLAAGLGCDLARVAPDGSHRPGLVQCGAYYPDLLVKTARSVRQ